MEVWKDIISVVISNGIFATLFVLLFFYQLKDSRQRENKYQKTIAELTKHIGTIQEIKEDVEELKTVMIRKRRKQNETQTND